MLRIDFTYDGLKSVRTRWVEEQEDSSAKCGEIILPSLEFETMKALLEHHKTVKFKFVEKTNENLSRN